MLKGGELKPHVEQRHVNRVSSAFWPVHIRKGVSTGKAAQRRRDWIMQGRWWIVLIDALSMRVILVSTTLLVVTTSLLVAVLGLRFWYLLLLPLLLFTLLLIVPVFLASRAPQEIMPPPLTQDMRSSAGFLSQRAHELRNSTGFLSQYAHELRSSAGTLSQYAHELRSEPGLLTSEAPATPTLIEPPLVRVLETYDLRTTPVKHFLANIPEDTSKPATIRSLTQDF
jgi:signal transduction histidine kinase